MPTAYTYIRWSTDEQTYGSSLERQREAVAQIAKRTKLPIVDLPIDDGVSAKTGRNQREGSLGAFLDDVDAGQIERGSVLCVEDVDRLSRAGPLNTLQLIDRLKKKGISVVTSDGVFDLDETGPMITGTIKSILAQAENRKKATRVRAAWAAKRRKAEAGEATVYAAVVPGWVEMRDGRYELIPSKCDTVLAIFKMARSGLGAQAIANRMNEKKVPHIGRKPARAWYASYVRRIIRGRAVLGEVQTRHGATLKILPAVLGAADWHAAQSVFIPRGRPSPMERNLFRGLVFSGRDGSPMLLKNKSDGYVYYTSAATLERRAKKKHTVPYLEDDLVEWLDTYAGRVLEKIAIENDDRFMLISATIAEDRRKLENLVKVAEIGDAPIAVVAERMRALQTDIEHNETKLAVLRNRPINTPELRNLHTTAGRARYRRELARFIQRIWIDDDTGRAIRVQMRGEDWTVGGTIPNGLHVVDGVVGPLTAAAGKSGDPAVED